ncbi:hypothetical protein [Aeromonas veronii]|uniref:hypothetical protein n=1 Tax=Aeromonas veronii TaxID=654 RepID=UPI0040555F68
MYKNDFDKNIFFNEIRKIRNIFTHEIITYSVNGNGIVFTGCETGMEIHYCKYYSSHESTINISKFMCYHTKLLARELLKILPPEPYMPPYIEGSHIKNGLKIISNYNISIDILHDEYIHNIMPTRLQIQHRIFENNDDAHNYIDSCKSALRWIQGKEELFPIDNMHLHISIALYSNNSDDVFYFAKKSEDIINSLSGEYPFVTIYLTHIYMAITRLHYNKRDKKKCIRYALMALESSQNISTRILDRVSHMINLANAYSLYESRREIRVLINTYDLLLQVEKEGYKNTLHYKYAVSINVLESFSLHAKSIPAVYMENIESLLSSKSELKKLHKQEIKIKLIKYYKSNKRWTDALSLVKDLISKKNFTGKYKIYLKLDELQITKNIRSLTPEDFNPLLSEINRLDINNQDDKFLLEWYSRLML